MIDSLLTSNFDINIQDSLTKINTKQDFSKLVSNLLTYLVRDLTDYESK